MLTPYLSFNGNTEEAFNFYKNAFNGTLIIQRFGDAPNADQLSEADRKKIMHVALEAPYGVRLMGNDYMDFMGETFVKGNNFSLSLHPDSEALADNYFASLSEGGTVIVPMSTAPWGDYFGMFRDKFGVKWMINHQAKK